ncbi:hypothetical protein ES705_24588 [subsurface metagenome]
MPDIRQVAFCPHCGNQAPQKHIHTQEYWSEEFDDNGEPFGLPCAYYVVVCETCDSVLLYHDEGDIVLEENFHRTTLVYPDSGTLHRSVPDIVSACYAEAVRTKRTAPNAFAVQIRRALEAMCDERGATAGSLQRRLQSLAERSEIPAVLSEMTDVLRILGNIGAHAGEQSVHSEHVDAIDDFFRAIVEYVYVAPSKFREFRDTLEQISS